MTGDSDIVVVLQDTGGANAVLPVVRELRSRGATCRIIAAGKARSVLDREGVEHEAVDVPAVVDASTVGLAGSWLRPSASALLLGTSWGPSVEKAAAVAARGLVRSVAVLDMWSYYAQRFENTDTGALDYLPDRVAVMDDEAARAAISAGLPADRVVVTGQPYLETLPERFAEASLIDDAARLRATWAPDGRPVIMFASEPIARDLAGSDLDRGYTERDALCDLVEAAARSRHRPVIVAKPHPEHGPNEHDWVMAHGGIVAQGLPSWHCIAAADVVVGMTSMVLLEALFAGKASISHQPTARPFPFVGDRYGIAATRDVDDLAAHLTAALAAQGPPTANPVAGAAGRVAELVLAMAS